MRQTARRIVTLAFTLLLLVLASEVASSQVSIDNNNGSSAIINGRDLELMQRQGYQNNNGEIIIQYTEAFNTNCAKVGIDLKVHNVWGVFWLPPKSQKFTLYIKKGSVNVAHVATIRHYIDNVIYTKTWEIVMRQGYNEVTMRADTKGNYYYRNRNDWVNGMMFLPHGGFTTFNGPTGFNPRLGEFPYRQTEIKERLETSKDTYIFLEDRTRAPQKP